MRQISAERKKVVILAAMVACISAIGPLLVRGNRTLVVLWVGCLAVALVFVIALFAKVMRKS